MTLIQYMKIQLFVSSRDTRVTLNVDQGHPNWYEPGKQNTGYHPTEYDRELSFLCM